MSEEKNMKEFFLCKHHKKFRNNFNKHIYRVPWLKLSKYEFTCVYNFTSKFWSRKYGLHSLLISYYYILFFHINVTIKHKHLEKYSYLCCIDVAFKEKKKEKGRNKMKGLLYSSKICVCMVNKVL